MFGFSFSELVVVILVALVVMGPKDLPKMLRRLGQLAGKVRRAAADLRAQSGIDDALRADGLADDIAEIRKLARGELDAVRRAASVEAPAHDPYGRGDELYMSRTREYPRDGADAYGALPESAIVYAEALAPSPLARDPLYVVGDADAELPPEPEPEPAPVRAAVPTLLGVGAVSASAASEAGPTLLGVGAVSAPAIDEARADGEPSSAPAEEAR